MKSIQEEVKCKCGYTWCFSCKEEGHRPANCEIVQRWILKNTAESENVNWIIANCKQCPKCKKNIEKNQGCNNIKCPVSTGGCGYSFCWMCLEKWDKHGSDTGG